MGIQVLLPKTDFLVLVDKVAAVRALADTYIGTSAGEASTMAILAKGLRNAILTDLDDWSQVVDSAMGQQAQLTFDACVSDAFIQDVAQNFINAMEGHMSKAGSTVSSSITSISTYCVYYNNDTGYSCLMSPEFYDILVNVLGKTITDEQAFCIVTTLAEHVDATGFADIAAVGSAYAEMDIEGYVSVAFEGMTGTGAVTVTGDDQTGASMDWTGTLPENAAGTTVVTLTPDTPGRRCRDVTAITIADQGQSAGTLQVRTVRDRALPTS